MAVVGRESRLPSRAARKVGGAGRRHEAFRRLVKTLPGSGVRRVSGGVRFPVCLLVSDRFAGESPFSFSALDMKTYAMALLKTEYRETVKKNMPTALVRRLAVHACGARRRD